MGHGRSRAAVDERILFGHGHADGIIGAIAHERTAARRERIFRKTAICAMAQNGIKMREVHGVFADPQTVIVFGKRKRKRKRNNRAFVGIKRLCE